MKIQLKYLFLAFAGLGIHSFTYSQSKTEEQGEIVMTKDELNAFLDNIADKKRKQIEKRRRELTINRQMDDAFKTKDGSNRDDMSADFRLYREFDRINSRIDMLMLNMNNGRMNYYPPPPAGYQQSITPSPYYYDPSYQNRNNLVPGTGTSGVLPQDEEMRRQNQVSALNEELRVLNQLSRDLKSNDYDSEIAALKNRLNELNAQVEKKNTNVNNRTIIIDNSNDMLLKGLQDYHRNIYFGNNKSAISNEDKATLKQLAALVKENSPRVTVVVRGFASHTGSAKYNNELSFKRAEAVKQYLLQCGLDARDILTMYHGIDNGSNEQQARRVELSLLVQ